MVIVRCIFFIVSILSFNYSAYAYQDKPKTYEQAVTALINETAMTDIFYSGANVNDIIKSLEAKGGMQGIAYIKEQSIIIRDFGLNKYIRNMYKFADNDLSYLDSIYNIKNLNKKEAMYRTILLDMSMWGKILDDYDAKQPINTVLQKYEGIPNQTIEVIYKFKAISESLALYRLRLGLEDLVRLAGRELYGDPDYIWKRLKHL